MIEIQAKEFALAAHKDQLYGEQPYAFHLAAVVAVAKEFKLNDNIIAACWLHDTMEDCNVSFQDIKNVCGETVAEIVFCVTDELGRNRKERKEKTYPKIAGNADALCVKLCDRIANVQHSIVNHNSALLSMYVKKQVLFKEKLFNVNVTGTTLILWKKLEELMSEATQLQKIN
jgi:(p)ppGpp synthase/HD superfamily hydrolase